jgi:hypothetical protein
MAANAIYYGKWIDGWLYSLLIAILWMDWLVNFFLNAVFVFIFCV